jgi:hypothetical protein
MVKMLVVLVRMEEVWWSSNGIRVMCERWRHCGRLVVEVWVVVVVVMGRDRRWRRLNCFGWVRGENGLLS